LKDLETKVDDLEKASEATNHENGRLRAQVEKLNMEMKEYRKRLALNSTGAGPSPPLTASPTKNLFNNTADFQFAFPKFGDLPGASFMTNGSFKKTTPPPAGGQTSTSNSTIPGVVRHSSSGSTSGLSPQNPSNPFTSPISDTMAKQSSASGSNQNSSKNSFDEFNGLFSPSILETASRSSSLDYFPINGTSTTAKQGSMSSNNGQGQIPKAHRASSTSMTASPASSMSQIGLDSSCGTTPEASADSPDNRKPGEGTLNTINEEGALQNITGGKKSFSLWLLAQRACSIARSANLATASSNFAKSPTNDINGIDWMAQQNGGQFDPVLFGDYRDPQDNILNNSFGDFFNDAFPLQDFSSPFNTGELPEPQPKRDLMKEIEVQQNSDNIKPAEQPKKYLGCDKLWYVFTHLPSRLRSLTGLIGIVFNAPTRSRMVA